MKTVNCLLLTMFLHTLAFGQETLVKDLDNDTVSDTVYIDKDASRIVCRLSTQNFLKMQSKKLELLIDASSIKVTKSGFEFSNNYMRAGNACQFRYDANTKKIQLIGMSRYEFGNATNDGSGESSVNLLTNNYIGNWNYFDSKKEKLIKLPTIKTKMTLGKIYLESFSDTTYFTYAEKCAALYEKSKPRTTD